MIKIMGREVSDIASEHAKMPGVTPKNAPLGVSCLLKGDRNYRWVPYDVVEWVSEEF